MIKIKKLKLSDVSDCMNLFNCDFNDLKYFNSLGWSPEQITNQFNKNINFSFGGYYNNSLVAFIIGDLFVIENALEYEILFIYVKKSYRKNGFANNLLNHIFFQKSKIKLKKIFLEVAENNIPAIKLYEKNKFIFINVRKNYYNINEKKINSLCYVKNL